MIDNFEKDIEEGLSSFPKTLPSKYFYDKRGDELFVKIMHAEEYYLTRAELDIFQNKTQQIIDCLQLEKNTYFELIELGAGNGLKTKKLLQQLSEQNYKFDYLPVDISQNSLDLLERSINKEMPKVSIQTKQGDYFQVMESLKYTHHPKVVLFLGSNLGNMSDDIASQFIYNLGKHLSPNDKLLIGVDLIKSRDIVAPAYNDSQGYTKAFNLNLLTRINRELKADFDINNFSHQPEYLETEGIARSFLVSKIKQSVFIEKLNKTFHFDKGEKIATEISRKYNDQIIKKIIEQTDFTVVNKLIDSKNYFCNYILQREENTV